MIILNVIFPNLHFSTWVILIHISYFFCLTFLNGSFSTWVILIHISYFCLSSLCQNALAPVKILGTFSIFVCQVDTDRVNLQPLWLTHIPLICCPLSESHPWQLSANDGQQKGSQSCLNAWHHWSVSFWPAVHMFLYAFMTWSQYMWSSMLFMYSRCHSIPYSHPLTCWCHA